MNIETVKDLQNSYLVNGSITVPKDPSNSDYQRVQKWIAQGNTPDPEFTDEELLENAVNRKLEELEGYYNSEEARTVIIAGHKILNTPDFRYLVSEQKDRFAEKIELGLITEAEAIFNYQHNGGGIIPLTYQQLRIITVTLQDLASVNFDIKQNHRNEILSLAGGGASIDHKKPVKTLLKQIEEYDIRENFIINQSYNL